MQQKKSRSPLVTWAARLLFTTPPLVLAVAMLQLATGHFPAQRAAHAPPAHEAVRVKAQAIDTSRRDQRVLAATVSRPAVSEPDATLDSARVDLAATEPLTRREGIAELASIGGDAVVPELMLAALYDRDARVREEAVRAVAEIAPDSSVPTLGQALRDPEEGVRRAALAALGELESPDAERWVRATAADSRHPMRAMAADVLAQK